MTEEERAALYREQFAARAQARRDRFIGLAGDRARRVELDIAWQPVLLAQLEVQMPVGDDCSDALEEMYVQVPEADIFTIAIPDDQLV
jgi:hypothetical protein